jgi:ABC-type Na+ efflux pump permease subunit
MEGTKMTDPHKYASPEQLRYAKVLGIGVQVGFALLVLSFLLYLFGVLPPLVPVDQLPKYWGLPVAEFVKATNTPTGWGWVAQIGKGDMLNLVGIAVLAGISAVSSLAVLPIFARRGEVAHLLIAVLQIIVLAVSASNILVMLR